MLLKIQGTKDLEDSKDPDIIPNITTGNSKDYRISF